MTELIVALDAPYSNSLDVYCALAGVVKWFKVGVPLLLQEGGRGLAAEIGRRTNEHLMLDLKLYDTRDTVLRAVDAASALGASMLTVHADCVPGAIEGRTSDDLKIISVNALTDGTGGGIDWLNGADGYVCHVLTAHAARSMAGRKVLVCPGVRPTWHEAADNHRHPQTPTAAVHAGADYIVVGRPIIAAPDPAEAAKHILRELHASVPPLSP